LQEAELGEDIASNNQQDPNHRKTQTQEPQNKRERSKIAITKGGRDAKKERRQAII
jgi:hypothetical protein